MKIVKLFGRDKPKREEMIKCPYCEHENPRKVFGKRSPSSVL